MVCAWLSLVPVLKDPGGSSSIGNKYCIDHFLTRGAIFKGGERGDYPPYCLVYLDPLKPSDGSS